MWWFLTTICQVDLFCLFMFLFVFVLKALAKAALSSTACGHDFSF